MFKYTKLDTILHKMALGPSDVAELSFDLERRVFSACPKRTDAIHVTGLARAGTTAMMRGLYASGEFGSLTYNDMPFVLAPNLWGKITRLQRKERVLEERAHGDGIRVDFDSPEALEEVFWRLFCGKHYIKDEMLCIHNVDAQTVSAFKRYQDLICYKYGKSRYLSKNNNHILRLRSIAGQLTDTVFLILFRDPVAQAESLLQQHRKFSDSNLFTRQYMTWLAHHEFGSTHRPFQIDENITPQKEAFDLQYWIDRWTDAYKYLLSILKENRPNLIAVSYEELCNQPRCWDTLSERLRIPQSPCPFRTLNASKQEYQKTDTQEARRIYRELTRISTVSNLT